MDELVEIGARAMCAIGCEEVNDKACETCTGWFVYSDLASAFLTALSDRGMAVVPVEPTEAMKHDGSAAYDYPSVYMGGPSEGGKRLSARIWKAMLAARPSLKEGSHG